jgi:glutathione synthase/RimK-type ligase-like ATP-grasp enzyme
MPPRPDLVINNIVNAERLSVPGALETVGAVADSFGVPVINHPRLAKELTRQKNAQRLAGIAGVIAPRLSRYVNRPGDRGRIMAEIEASFPYPLIIRTVFEQMGAGTWLVRDREAMQEVLGRLDGQEIYVIEFIESRHQDGLYRQFRAAFVNGNAILVRADFSDYWNVRARRNPSMREFYKRRPDLAGVANQFITHPERTFVGNALKTIQTIAATTPLDIYGMDFDITDNGDIVVFEINATMNLLSQDTGGLPYPSEPEENLLRATRAYFENLASRPM